MRRGFSTALRRSAWSARPEAATARRAGFSSSAAQDDGSCRQYVSLYRYAPVPQDELPRLRRRMLAVWTRMDVRGRVYVSQEGVNAQVTMPQTRVAAFADSFPDVFTRHNMFLGALIPDSETADRDAVRDQEAPELLCSAARRIAEPFEKLDIRIRDQIVRDDFDKGHLDLQDSGNALPPREWHERLQARNAKQDDSTLVLDVRNFYEHEIGRFDGATRIMVDTFRDTFDAVDEILARHEVQHDGEKPKEVMMYCTGGIRCEKVGAYLAQYKGITNVHKLHGGIVNYMRFLQESKKGAEQDSDKSKAVESLFKGRNFVFDQRCVTNGVDAVDVTPDVLGECFQCGEPCNQHTNCRNLMCGGLILQCTKCAASYYGACSDACKEELIKMNALKTPAALKAYRKQHAGRWKPAIPNALPKYRQRMLPALQHGASSFCTHAGKDITRDMAVDDEARLNAYVNRMSSGHDDDQLLAELRKMTVRDLPKATQLIDEPQGRLLSFLVQLTPAKRVLEIGCFTGYSAICIANGLAKDGVLTTCDVDADTMRVAETYFARSTRASQIHSVLSDGMAYLDVLGERRSASTDDDETQFDVIFVDANKRQYLAYYEAVLSKQLLHPNGLLIFDNTLFRGRVLACDLGTGSKKERIAQGLTNFNAHVASDPRTVQVLLPLWDGLTIVRQV